ncbi:permease [Vibrio mimicus MB451]|nr:permease [Vibrio mimicus MB451]
MMALPWVMLSTPNMGTFVAMVALVCTALSFILTPFFSTLIDRFSRKRLLVGVQLLQAGTAAVVALVYGAGYESNELLAAAQLMFWTSSNLAWSTNNAFTQENFYQHEYASISGKQEVIMQGTTLGSGALGVVLLWFSEMGISGDWFAGYNIAFGLGSLVTGLFVTRLLGLGSHQGIMIGAMGLAATTLVGMSFSSTPQLLLMFTFFFGTFNALNRIARTNWMHHSINIDQRGRADGGLQMFATLVQSISYVAIAFLSHFGITQLGFLFASVVMVAAVLLMVRLNKGPELAMRPA